MEGRKETMLDAMKPQVHHQWAYYFIIHCKLEICIFSTKSNNLDNNDIIL